MYLLFESLKDLSPRFDPFFYSACPFICALSTSMQGSAAGAADPHGLTLLVASLGRIEIELQALRRRCDQMEVRHRRRRG